ncbi:cyclin [Pseudozyma hubeiensis SY62]|uniref:Cyclin n=1 Tax=Pseudozyma hubeiensis (strain SY62) TaxID=1305764 RepID=R9P1Y5_PSEHS|nr:cyclin [Pseudozyma hubeiensis SY62]GAC95197.1 cyclin [Pseudozyma hubeiensis SY62]
MCHFSAHAIAMGCLLLSTKLEETQCSLRHLIGSFHYVTVHLNQTQRSSKYEPPCRDSSELVDLRDTMVVSEMQVLKRLGFQVHVTLPYALLVNYMQVLGLTDRKLKVTVQSYDDPAEPVADGRHESMPLAQCAWSLLNDALQTPLLCIFGPHVVACTAIALAAEMCTPLVRLPLHPAPWWLLFDASEAEIKIAASHLLWRYHHSSSCTDLAELLDRRELQRYIAGRSADSDVRQHDVHIHRSR